MQWHLNWRCDMTLEKSYQRPQFSPYKLIHQSLYVRLSFGHPKNFCHFDVALTIGHIIYYRKGGSGSSPSLGHGVSYELVLLVVHLCNILALTSINHLFFLFMQIDLNLNSCLWIHPNPSWNSHLCFHSWELRNAPWVFNLLQTLKSTSFFTFHTTSDKFKKLLLGLHFPMIPTWEVLGLTSFAYSNTCGNVCESASSFMWVTIALWHPWLVCAPFWL
jgi:hypothetical protein